MIRAIKQSTKSTFAIGYVRVSTETQVKAGVSLEAQQAMIEGHCKSRGLTLVQMIVEPGVSAAKVSLADRAGGSQLLQAINAGDVGIVCVAKLDRAFRNAVETLIAVDEWEKLGVALHLLDLGGMSVDTGTAMGKMFLTMLAGLAEMERNVISERTSAAMAHKKAVGELVGKVPTGFQAVPSGRTKTTKDGTVKDIMVLQADPREQAAIARIAALHRSGMSLRQIGKTLTLEGFSPRGKAWAVETVARVVRRLEPTSSLADAR